jgi:YVTN family beta-propeller protein
MGACPKLSTSSRIKLLLLYLIAISCGSSSLLLTLGIVSNPLPVVAPIVFPGSLRSVFLPFDSSTQSIAITPDGSKAYVADSINSSVSVIDLITNEVVAILPVGSGPTFIAISPDGLKAYVANSGSQETPGNTISIIDTQTDKIINTLTVGSVPRALGIVVVTDTISKLYVVNSGTQDDPDNTVSVINVLTDTVVTSITVGINPVAIGINPKRLRVYVANTDKITVIDVKADKAIDTIPIRGSGPTFLSLVPDGSKLYALSSNINRLSIIDTTEEQVAKTIEVGKNPVSVAITPDGLKALVTNFSDNSVSIIDTTEEQVVKTIEVGKNPVSVAITPDGLKALVTNFSDNSVSIIDTTEEQVVKTIEVDPGPDKVNITPDGFKAYVTHPADKLSFSQIGHTLSVIDIGAFTSGSDNGIVSTIDTGLQPADLKITPDGSKALVVSFFNNTVSIIDTLTDEVVAILKVGVAPLSIAISPDGKKAFIANSVSKSVSVLDLDSNQITTTLMLRNELPFN